MISHHPADRITAGQVTPIFVPPRRDLWARIRLAIAVLDHGRVDRDELLAILNGTPIATLARQAVDQ